MAIAGVWGLVTVAALGKNFLGFSILMTLIAGIAGASVGALLGAERPGGKGFFLGSCAEVAGVSEVLPPLARRARVSRVVSVLALLAVGAMTLFLWMSARVATYTREATPYYRTPMLEAAVRRYQTGEGHANRAILFQQAAGEINMRQVERGDVTHVDLLRDLGPPDYFDGARSRPTMFVYVYTATVKQDGALIVEFDAGGKVALMGWGQNKPNDFSGMKTWDDPATAPTAAPTTSSTAR
jgi:hypothetical protein